MNPPSKTSILLLALLTSLAIPLSQPGRQEGRTLAQEFLAQDMIEPVPTFTPPTSVAAGTTLTIDGSPSMRVINQALKQGFESRYPNSQVNFSTSGTDAALQSLLQGNVDLAAIGRPLTDAEIAQGLTQIPISREKIAIIVGRDNPFQGDLTFGDFARIFRGEITNWAQVGGPNLPLRFIDRPAGSDTRQALGGYEIFQNRPFETGANAVQVGSDDTAEVVRELGNDGMSYAIASQVLDQENVRVVTMHGTLPDDPRYPYSQPRGYVYRGEPSLAIEAFLGFATNPEGQAVVAAAKANEAATVATADLLPGQVAVSPDGDLIVRGTQDGRLEWYDGQGNTLGITVPAHTNLVTGLAFAPDGETLVSSSADGTIRRWDRQGSPVGQPIQGENGPITALAISPDGQQIAGGRNDGSVQKWSADGTPAGGPIEAHQGSVRALTFSPDGQTLISGGSDGAVRRWNPNGSAAGDAVEAHPEGVTALASSPDGQFLVSGGNEGTLQFWQADGTPRGESVTAHDQGVTAIAISPDGQTVASAGQDSGLRLWDADGTPRTPDAETFPGPLGDLAYTPQGNLVASPAEGDLQLRNPQGRPLTAGADDVPALPASPNFNLPPEITNALQNLPGPTWWIIPAIPILLILVGLIWSLLGGKRHSDDPEAVELVEEDDDLAVAEVAPAPGVETFSADDFGTDGSEAEFQPAADIPPDSSWVGMPADAIAESSLGEKLNQAKANLSEGNRLASTGHYADALNHFNNAIEAAEVERMKAIAAGTSLAGATLVLAQATASRGEVLALLGRSERAIESFNRALEMDDNITAAWIGKGHLLASTGQLDEALFCFDKALELDPNAGSAWAGKGRALIELGQTEEGQTHLNRAAELGGDTTTEAPAAAFINAGEPTDPASQAFSPLPGPLQPAAPDDSMTDAPMTEGVPVELQQAVADLPSAETLQRPAGPLADLEVPASLQAVVAALPDEPELPEHAFISSEQITNPDELDQPVAPVILEAPPQSSAPLAPAQSFAAGSVLPLAAFLVDEVSLPAPEELPEMAEALQARVDLSALATARPLRARPAQVTPTPVQPSASQGQDSRPPEPAEPLQPTGRVSLVDYLQPNRPAPSPENPDGNDPRLDEAPSPSSAGEVDMIPQPDPTVASGEAIQEESVQAAIPEANQAQLVEPDSMEQAPADFAVGFTAPAAGSSAAATIDPPDPVPGAAIQQPDNPDQDDYFASLPPEVQAALRGIPADSPDAVDLPAVAGSAAVDAADTVEPPMGSRRAAVDSPDALDLPSAEPGGAAAPPPVPANPRLAQLLPDNPADLPTSWMTLSPEAESRRLYTVWEISDLERTAARQGGGETLMIRLYDVTGQPEITVLPDPIDQQSCYELAKDWYLALPEDGRAEATSPRTYVAEVGYQTSSGGWLSLARSNPVAVGSN
jgi:ABC-type phosphate transport system substrate-binding protein/tetratricopeptide (TPR) repeat protein